MGASRRVVNGEKATYSSANEKQNAAREKELISAELNKMRRKQVHKSRIFVFIRCIVTDVPNYIFVQSHI